MSDYLKRYSIKLKVLSPVHIGSGEIINKKGYILDRKKHALYYPDLHSMMKTLRAQRLLEGYERLLLSKNGDLFAFLQDNLLDWADWCSEPISVGGIIESRFNEINTFIKDPYGFPYVPGSSVKGAFRNVILNHEARSRRLSGIPLVSLPLNPKWRRREADNEVKRIESDVFDILNRNDKKRNTAVNDVMAAFRFSDSKPLPKNTLMIGRKMDQPVKYKRGEIKQLPTYRECLKPGTVIDLTLTVDTALLQDTSYVDLFERKRFKTESGKVIEMPVFIARLRNFNLYYHDEYRMHFSDIEPLQPNVLYLGGGTGFLTKTMMIGLLEKEPRLNYIADYLNNNFKKHKHYEDKNLGVSPRMLKLTEFNGKRYEMGRCAISIEEI